MAGGAEQSSAFGRAGAAQGEAAAGKQARPQERASAPASAARRLAAALGRAGRCAAGAVLGQEGLGWVVPHGAKPREAGPLWGSGLWAQAKEAPSRRPSVQGHLQASPAALGGSFSAAPRRRAPEIWRRWEPRHPRVCPSPGWAPALARGRGRAKGGLKELASRREWTGGSGGSPSPSGDSSARPCPVAPFPFGPASPRRSLPGAGRGADRPGSLQGHRRRAQPSSAKQNRAEHQAASMSIWMM